MRYEIRQNNGRFKVFDTQNYMDVSAHLTLGDAEAALLKIQPR
jgi:hypothetical protein